MNNPTELYPYAREVSHEYGVAVEKLIEIFQLEEAFHQSILETHSAEQRKLQYHDLYEKVHLLKNRDAAEAVDTRGADRLVLTFRKELEGRSILDVGCGNGLFLRSVARLLPHSVLYGLDTSGINTARQERPFRFLQEDITNFTVPRLFDTVFSHQVFEHIAPADTSTHLASIRESLVEGGTFIVCLPNKYWGPQDITRILDNTFRGRVPAQGSHLNESTFSEMIPVLEKSGFSDIRTVLPLGAFLPYVRGWRVRPKINRLLESNSKLRALNNFFTRGGKPIFKNPIMLVCNRA